jgi:hypothetical protein
MANEKATNLPAAGGDAAKAAPERPAAPLPGVAVASHLAAAAAAVEEFVARVTVYFDRVDGGFESPSPSGPLGTGGRYSSAWETPDTLGRAIDAICEFMFEVRAFEVDAGEIRRGMDGAWLVPHSKWSCDPPWTELCLEMIEVGKAIVEKKVEVQVGFQREDLSFKWVSDATMAWAAATVKWLRARADRLDPRRAEPDLGPREAAPVPKPAGWTRSELIEQANHDGEVLSATSFDELRKAARLKPGKRGGGGAQRRFSESDLAKLIVEAAKKPRKGKPIVAAWRLLIPGS